jgi:exopolysaccharide biosynthesis polyprenyl glycosylphosphotransferase
MIPHQEVNMFRRFSSDFAIFSIFLDIILIDTALYLSSLLRGLLSVLTFVKDIPSQVELPVELYVIFPLVWVLVLLLFSVYDGRQNLRIVDEFGSLTLGTILAAVSMAGILYFTYRDVSRFLFLFFIAAGYGFMLLWRTTARIGFRVSLQHGMQVRRVLVLGAGQIGCRMADQIRMQPFLGLKLVGFLDDDSEKQASMPEVLGPLDIVRKVIYEKQVEDVVIALPLSAHKRLTQIVSVLQDLPVRVRVIPDFFSLTLHRASFEDFAGLPMLDLRAPALSEYQRMIKRTFDLLVTLTVMPFVLPVMAVIALAIRLDSPGSLLFHADRIGENGRRFRMHKFRTMVEDADRLIHLVEKQDEEGHVLFKRPDDPRITLVGRFLRKTSLDELPQLFNVLKGEMSLVGPRPEMPALVERYASWQRKRFVVPQGMTGWWQVNGRSDKPMHLHTDEDLYYVQHYSIWLDLQILARTIWVVLRGKGAY